MSCLGMGFNVCQEKRKKLFVKKCYDGVDDSWKVPIRRVQCQYEESKYESSLYLLFNVLLAGSRILLGSSLLNLSTYSSSGLFHPCFLIWLGLARLMDAVLLTCNDKKGVINSRLPQMIFLIFVFTCGRERQSINHLFVQCDISFSIWNHFFRCGFAWPFQGL